MVYTYKMKITKRQNRKSNKRGIKNDMWIIEKKNNQQKEMIKSVNNKNRKKKVLIN